MWWVGGGKDVAINLGINIVTAIAMIVLHVVVDAGHLFLRIPSTSLYHFGAGSTSLRQRGEIS